MATMMTAMRTSSSPCAWTLDGSTLFWRQKEEDVSLPCRHPEVISSNVLFIKDDLTMLFLYKSVSKTSDGCR